jgi:hypothetical protein
MFRAHSARHQERQMYQYNLWQQSFYVGGQMVCRLEVEQLDHQHRMIVTRGCMDTVCLS